MGFEEIAEGSDDGAIVLPDPRHLDNLLQRAHVVRRTSRDLEEEVVRAIGVALEQELLDQGDDGVVGLVGAGLDRVDLDQDDAGFLALGRPLEDALEGRLRVRHALRPQISLAQLHHRLGGGLLGSNFLEVGNRLVIAALGEVDLPELGLDLDPAIDLEALLEHLDRFGRMALEVQLLRDRDVLPNRLRGGAFLRVDVGEPRARP